MRLVQISDLHHGRFYLPDVALDLQAKISELEPDVILVSGDLTQRAKVSEFESCVRYLGTLPSVPMIVVPGNHDIPLYNLWTRAFHPLARYDRYLSDFTDEFKGDNVRILGLDSTNPRRAFVNGRISEEQLAKARAYFADSPDQSWRMLVVHHHLLPPPGYERRKAIAKADRMLEAFQEAKVDVVFCGHLHRAYIGNTLDVHPGPERSNGMIVVQCGTSSSRRGRGMEREKNSFNVVDIDGDEMTVAHWIYFETSDGFVCTSEHRFSKPSSGPSINIRS